MAQRRTKPKKRKVYTTGCYFCEQETTPHYLKEEELARFVSDRAKIVPKEYSGLCSKHQRRMSVAVKRARHLALLPYKTGL